MKTEKLLKTFILTTGISASFAASVFAAGWQKDAKGWRYQYDNGGFAAGKWELIKDSYYYFDRSGYMLSDAVTPDGYYVGESGAWDGKEASAAEKEKAAENAFTAFIKAPNDEKQGQNKTAYSFIDLNGDGISEMLAAYGTWHSADVHAYKYVNGEVVEAASAGCYGACSYYTPSGIIAGEYDNMGVSETYYYDLNGVCVAGEYSEEHFDGTPEILEYTVKGKTATVKGYKSQVAEIIKSGQLHSFQFDDAQYIIDN